MTISVGVIGTKGGIGKTSLVAYLAAILADMDFRVLIIDADPQASVSKFYPLHQKAENGIVELLLGENSRELVQSTISKTIYPNLHIVRSNDLSDDHRRRVEERLDRAFLLLSKLTMPFIEENCDFVIFDTQGAVGPVQDAVALASSFLLSPIKPDVLSAREYISGTEDSLKRLISGSNPMMNIKVPPLKAIIYAQDRTQDASLITESLKTYFNQYIDGTQSLLNTIIPSQVSFKTAATK